MVKKYAAPRDMGPYLRDFWSKQTGDWTEDTQKRYDEALRKDTALASGRDTYTTSTGQEKSLVETEPESEGGSSFWSKAGSTLQYPFVTPKRVVGNVAEWAFTKPGVLESIARAGGGQGVVEGIPESDDDPQAARRALVLQQPVQLSSGRSVVPVPEGQSFWGAIKQGLTGEDPVHLGTAFARGTRGGNLTDEQLKEAIRSGKFAEEQPIIGNNMAAAIGLLGDPWTYAGPTALKNLPFFGKVGQGKTARQVAKSRGGKGVDVKTAATNVARSYPSTARTAAMADTTFTGGEGDPLGFLTGYGLTGAANKAVPALVRTLPKVNTSALKSKLPGPALSFPASAAERGVDPALLARQSELQSAIFAGNTLDDIIAMPKQTVVPGRGVVRNELPYDAAYLKTALNSEDAATRAAAMRFMSGQTSSPFRLSYDPKMTGPLQAEREAAMSQFLREGAFGRTGKQLAKAAEGPASTRGATGKFEKNFLRADAQMIQEGLKSSDPQVRGAARQLLKELKRGPYGN